jgi:ribosomal protein S18 acetylase RimI-like enzyme
VIRRATRADAGALAALHAASLPSSLLSKLGTGALVRYYQYLMDSEAELVWVADEDGAVAGGCVLSDQPQTMLGRFARHAPFRLARELAVQTLRDRDLRARLARRLRDPGAEPHDPPHSPEVTQIFTDPRLRGRGLGAQLLRTCEATLRTRGSGTYFVHTQRDDNDAGIRFYRREGFVTIGESRSFGEAFLVMQKELD